MRWVVDAATPERDSAGGVAGFVGTLADITEKREIEARLEQSRRLEALGHLTGGVAHDFNNLLTTITGNATLVVDQLAPDDARREPLVEIVSASERAQRFTKQLLAFSRKQVLETEPIDLGEVVTGMQLMLARLIGPEIGRAHV